jgi:SPX domain protein involved in polyphosphate accumulation
MVWRRRVAREWRFWISRARALPRRSRLEVSCLSAKQTTTKMKFGQQLEDSEYPEWKVRPVHTKTTNAQYYYLDYNGLKQQLRQFTPDAGEISDENEQKFIELLEKELDKVSSFRQLKADELNKRIAACETSVEAKLAQTAPEGVGEDWNTKRFQDVKVELDKISHEFNELNKFNRFNYTGFLKILKKHDKFSGRDLKSLFTIRLNHRPFFQWNTDSDIIRMSKLYDAIKVGGKRDEALASMGGKQQDFVRKTIKYWVHPGKSSLVLTNQLGR